MRIVLNILTTLVGVLGYAAAIGTIIYFVAFIANLDHFNRSYSNMPDSLIRGMAQNALLFVAFGLHHSIAARRAFKTALCRWVTPALERTTYLIGSIVFTLLLIHFWAPLPFILWEFQNPYAITTIYALFGLSFLLMLVATFQIGHFEFFGLTQTLLVWAKKKETQSSFSIHFLYRFVRHPISLGWLTMPWLVPSFTLGQMQLAVSFAVYIFIVTPFEEADLEAEIGPKYTEYADRTPRFFPWKTFTFSLGKLTKRT